MIMDRKYLTGYIEKAAEDSGYDGTFVLSTESPDRDGDVIKQEGWALDNFVKNPIALWQHDTRSPVGFWDNVRVETNRLVADLKLGTTNLAEMTRRLIKDDVLRAVSVGFRPVDYEPMERDGEFKGWLINKAELLEASLVSVPANAEALQISKALNLTDEDRASIFEEFEAEPESGTPPPDSSPSKSAPTFKRPLTQRSNKMNLSESIVKAQEALADLKADLNTAGEQYAEDPSPENRDVVDQYSDEVAKAETHLATLKKLEKAMVDELPDPAAAKAAMPKPRAKAPALVTSTKNYEEGELFFKQAAVTALAHVLRVPVTEVLRDRYKNDKGLEAIMTKADSVIGTTTGTNWAAPLLEESVEGFLDLFTNNSVYGALRANAGATLNFAGKGSIKIPSRGSTKKPSGAFVAEGSPIPVKEAYFTSATLTPDKMGVIVPFAEELVTATNNQIETIIRNAIVQDTAEALDAALLDNTAVSTTRPAGLLNGVTATNSAGDTAANIITDVKTLMANFVSDDAQKNVWMIMNGARRLGVATVLTTVGERAFPEIEQNGTLLGVPVIVSGAADANTVISINSDAFYTAYDAPRFAMSNTAVLHMEDTTPLEVVDGEAVPVTADPVRSLFQTDSMAIRMILPVTWKMVRASMVDAIDTVTW